MRIIESGDRTFPDAHDWDALVLRDPRGHLLQTWAWGQLKGEFGWVPTRVAVEQDGALVAGAQVLYRKAGPLSIGYIPKGPVLATTDQDAAQVLWHAVHACSRRMRAIYLKVEAPLAEGDPDAELWAAEGRWRHNSRCIQPRRTIVVDLSADAEDIMARMKPKWRYNIRLSERKAVEVREAHAGELATFHSLLIETGRRDAFAVHSQEYYRRAWQLFAPLGRATLLLATHEGHTLAALMAFAFGRQGIYMYGASSDERRELMPNHLLQWRAMLWAKQMGCEEYDLWGIPDTDPESPTASLTGVERFKSGFGGSVVRFVGASDYVYNWPLYWLTEQAMSLRRPRPVPA